MSLFPDLDLHARDYEAEFEAFWFAYPQRKGNPKAEAREEWRKLAKGHVLPPLEIILAATRAFAAHHKNARTEEKFIEHARKFLKHQHWNDWMRDAPKPAAPVVIEPDWADEDPVWSRVKAAIVKASPVDWNFHFKTARTEPSSHGRVLIVKTAYDMEQIEKRYEGVIERILGTSVRIVRA